VASEVVVRPADGPITISIVAPEMERKAVSDTVPLIYVVDVGIAKLGLTAGVGAVAPLPPHVATLRPNSSAND
jgi:hypothetical protein